MLEKYAQEISEYLSSMMGRSIIITDTNGIIIGAPAKERLGEFHPPSVPCVKYKKMSFDDAEAAKKLGVWYPGSTVPLFYNGRVIGTAAIAGEPEVVLQFTMLVKNQIESMLREKILSPGMGSPQKKINELARDIGRFDPDGDDLALLTKRAARLGVNLEGPRGVIAIFFSNFRGLALEKNPVKLSYESFTDPISEEIDYSSTHSRVIELMREVFPDPQALIASVSRDRFAIICPYEHSDDERLMEEAEAAAERANDIHRKLKEASIETLIAIGRPARDIYELPMSYKNAWDVVKIADRLTLPPGVYSFRALLLEEMLLSVKPCFPLRFLDKKLEALRGDNDANELAETFKVYCESLFSKHLAAERLHLHRNTLSYRLRKIEERLGISMLDFRQLMACYMALHIKELGGPERR
ncbi:MAG: sugar diacid recognition domain-containing protein [Synergistaceae bacterium]|nr:sugar diacid recognition domain-containing protein [Synergistaceae bacterium]